MKSFSSMLVIEKVVGRQEQLLWLSVLAEPTKFVLQMSRKFLTQNSPNKHQASVHEMRLKSIYQKKVF